MKLAIRAESLSSHSLSRSYYTTSSLGLINQAVYSITTLFHAYLQIKAILRTVFAVFANAAEFYI